jgi:hypothetical protein
MSSQAPIVCATPSLSSESRRERSLGRARYRTVFETAAVAFVDVTATLPGGTMRARGQADFRRDSNVIRVVGGTGAFAGAKGTVEEKALPSGQTLNIYRLRRVP